MRPPAASGKKSSSWGARSLPDDALFTTTGALSGSRQRRRRPESRGRPEPRRFRPAWRTLDWYAGDPVRRGRPRSRCGTCRSADSTGELRAIGDTGVDFVLDDPARGGDGTGSTREMPQSHTVTLDIGDEGGHEARRPSRTCSRRASTARPSARSSMRARTRSSGARSLAGADQTAELAIDDLGLDVAGADTGKHTMRWTLLAHRRRCSLRSMKTHASCSRGHRRRARPKWCCLTPTEAPAAAVDRGERHLAVHRQGFLCRAAGRRAARPSRRPSW